MGTAEPDVLSARIGGRLAAALFIICGILVITVGPVLPYHPGASRRGLVAVGGAAALGGLVILRLPWARWPRIASLALLAPAFVLIDLHNVFTGGEGFLYPIFFMVAFVWLGLSQAPGWSLRLSPLLAAAYLVPLVLTDAGSVAGGSGSGIALASSVYAVPCCVVVGETVAWVAERLRRSEQALRTSEKRFRSLVEESADVVCVINAEGTITFASPALYRVLGHSPATWQGGDASPYLHADDLEGLRLTWESVLTAPSRIERFELRVLAADGRYRHCALVLQNLLDDPAVNGVVANFTDITERVEYRQELAESERTFRSLFAANPQPMYVYDLDS
ncbi:MAG TPA: PAS domain S-box protein, partial [Acidimicrobiales bacterium]|nr:PAS domain S-box protein [Acidimicrobiales bacterium]